MTAFTLAAENLAAAFVLVAVAAGFLGGAAWLTVQAIDYGARYVSRRETKKQIQREIAAMDRVTELLIAERRRSVSSVSSVVGRVERFKLRLVNEDEQQIRQRLDRAYRFGSRVH